MKGMTLIIVGTLIVVAAVIGLVHPQWQGRDKKVDVEFGDKHYVVTTRRIVNVPVGFCISIMVMGGCTVALGAVTRAKARQTQK
ncbi:MAG TPA: hypothetical protein VJS43_04640 [Candidatus Acidoferrales bacterium]|nr:hypothetical protein [Candidatus Acidoferrales bacterium]